MFKKIVFCLLLIFSSNVVTAQDSPPDPLLGIEQESRGPIQLIGLTAGGVIVSVPLVAISAGLSVVIVPEMVFFPLSFYNEYSIYSAFAYYLVENVFHPLSVVLHTRFIHLRRALTGQSQSKLEIPMRFYSSDNNFYLENTRDKFVIETKSSPSVFDLYLENRSLIKDVLFRPFANMGLYPARLFSNLHVHIDIGSAFHWDGQKIANFLVDTLNHPGFTKGATSQKWASSNTFSPVIENQILKLVPLLRKTENETEVRTLLSNYIHTRLSMIRFKESTGTLELRFLRNSRSVDEILSVLNLVKSRVRFLDAMVEEIQLLEYKERKKINKDLNLKDYVDETEANWDQFRKHLGIRYKSREMIRGLFNKVKKRCSFSTVQ